MMGQADTNLQDAQSPDPAAAEHGSRPRFRWIAGLLGAMNVITLIVVLVLVGQLQALSRDVANLQLAIDDVPTKEFSLNAANSLLSQIGQTAGDIAHLADLIQDVSDQITSVYYQVGGLQSDVAGLKRQVSDIADAVSAICDAADIYC